MHETYPPGGLNSDEETPPELREVLGEGLRFGACTTPTNAGFASRVVMFFAARQTSKLNHCTYDSTENRWFAWDCTRIELGLN